MSSRTWTVRQVLGVAAVASLALAGFMAPGRGATLEREPIGWNRGLTRRG